MPELGHDEHESSANISPSPNLTMYHISAIVWRHDALSPPREPQRANVALLASSQGSYAARRMRESAWDEGGREQCTWGWG